MAELYTVRMKRKLIVGKYDDKGKAIGHEERFVEECYHSLPLRTANGYRERFPDACIEILPTSQAQRGSGAFGDRPKSAWNTKVAANPGGNSFFSDPSQDKKAARRAKADIAKKTRNATYADALNAAMEAGR